MRNERSERRNRAEYTQSSNYIFTTALFPDVIRIIFTSLHSPRPHDSRIRFIPFSWNRWPIKPVPQKSSRIYLPLIVCEIIIARTGRGRMRNEGRSADFVEGSVRYTGCWTWEGYIVIISNTIQVPYAYLFHNGGNYGKYGKSCLV